MRAVKEDEREFKERSPKDIKSCETAEKKKHLVLVSQWQGDEEKT